MIENLFKGNLLKTTCEREAESFQQLAVSK
jgi:hypothetical protein